jgi:hypothetical protein
VPAVGATARGRRQMGTLPGSISWLSDFAPGWVTGDSRRGSQSGPSVWRRGGAKAAAKRAVFNTLLAAAAHTPRVRPKDGWRLSTAAAARTARAAPQRNGPRHQAAGGGAAARARWSRRSAALGGGGAQGAGAAARSAATAGGRKVRGGGSGVSSGVARNNRDEAAFALFRA